jgi:hypothetical protein
MTKIETKTKALEAIAGAAGRPLKIGDIEIPCYVLEDKTRVLSLRAWWPKHEPRSRIQPPRG